MSDSIRHECGVALVRLLKPLSYYYEKYDTPLWGFYKMFLLMEKQHNRGQDGAGVGALKLDVEPGLPFMFRERNIKSNSLDRIFNKLLKEYSKLLQKGHVHPEFAATLKEHFDFGAEILLGHLRYGTSGGYSLGSCHPYFRKSNWATKNLMLAGNFNITNNEVLNANLIQRGQHPIFDTDTQTLLEGIGFHLDQEHDHIYRRLHDKGYLGENIVDQIEKELDIVNIVRNSSRFWDGGYALAGMIGNGDSFVIRDPLGIRPFYYFKNDEVVAFASERAPLMTVFDQPLEEVREVRPGHVIVVKKDGAMIDRPFQDEVPSKKCSFERIYFSRGNDQDIYQERKKLGALLSDQILELIDHNLEDTVFSFIPNTAEIAYFGLLDELRRRRRSQVKEAISQAAIERKINDEFLDEVIMRNWPRAEKVAHKDIKLRTFISQESGRNQLASHVYDITYGILDPKDNLVCIDDSIVRGTTLKRSVIKILSRLNPRKIIIASTAPQIRYPDCYGIDMSQLGKFIAFQALMELMKEHQQEQVVKECYQEALAQENKADYEMENIVKKLYARFTEEDISKKISQLVSPDLPDWKGEVEVVYQSIENLHVALPGHQGDWYFTGNYPTPGGFKVLNKAFIYYYENSDLRSY